MTVERCWATIGTWGDASCSVLASAVHCRNCDVFAKSGRQLLDRVPPAEYIRNWTAVLAEARKEEAARERVAMIVSLTDAYYAIPIAICREAMDARPIRRLPHRTGGIVLGLVGVRGELRVCVSLAALGLDDNREPTHRKMVVLERDGREWVAPVGDIHGVHRYGAADLEPVPLTVSQSPNPYTVGLVRWGDRMVGVLDDEVLMSALLRRLA
jgi:chemotaxis-related protein WspD